MRTETGFFGNGKRVPVLLKRGTTHLLHEALMSGPRNLRYPRLSPSRNLLSRKALRRIPSPPINNERSTLLISLESRRAFSVFPKVTTTTNKKPFGPMSRKFRWTSRHGVPSYKIPASGCTGLLSESTGFCYTKGTISPPRGEPWNLR